MPVTFEMRVPPGEKAPGYPNDVPVEYVSIQGEGKDMVCRRATDVHRERYRTEYAAFLATLGPVVVEAPPVESKKPGFFSKKK